MDNPMADAVYRYHGAQWLITNAIPAIQWLPCIELVPRFRSLVNGWPKRTTSCASPIVERVKYKVSFKVPAGTSLRWGGRNSMNLPERETRLMWRDRDRNPRLLSRRSSSFARPLHAQTVGDVSFSLGARVRFSGLADLCCGAYY